MVTGAQTPPTGPRLQLRDRLRARAITFGGWVGRAGYLRKWLVLGILIGIIAGLGAVLFYTALRAANGLLLGGLAGYDVPQPVSEATAAGSVHVPRPWLLPLVVAAGGLLSGTIVLWLAPEAEGHGTDAAIDAIHRNPRSVRARVVGVKIVASAVTIGSGGSGGREGPTAQISAGFGSLLARTLDLSPEDGRIAVSIGIGSGIGAIFGAPLGGAVLAASIGYRDDFEAEALVPGLIASVTGYTVWGLAEGFSPMFGFAASGYEFRDPVQLLWFALIGLAAGLVGLTYARTYYGVAALANLLPSGRWRPLRPALGGLLVGLLALAVPQVLGTGYGWVQHALDRSTLMAIPLWIVLLLPFAKILATALSIGSGGSGGIFGPGVVIGAFLGAAVWRLTEPLGAGSGVPMSPAPFVIAAMMACFGAICRAPLGMMLMVAEMTGSLTILPPAMLAVGIAYLVVSRVDATIYRSQLRNRQESQAARLRFGLPLLGRIRVCEAMSTPLLVLRADTPIGSATAAMQRAGVPGAPVVDAAGHLRGSVEATALSDAPAQALLAHHVDPGAPSVHEGASLDHAVDALPEGHGWLTVVDDERRVRGIVAIPDIVRAYHARLRAEVRRAIGGPPGSGLAEVPVGAGSPLIGHPIEERAFPSGVIVLSVRRGDAVLLGQSSIALQAGDVVTILARPERLSQVRALLDPGSPAGPAR